MLATAALLGTGVAIALMVIPKPEQEVAAPAATPSPVEENAAKLGMTPAQKAARRSAVTTLDEQGFKPVRIADWHPEHTLRVLIGRDDTGAERAFFFVKRRFVGNDDAAASAAVRVSAARENGVTLTYRLFGDTDQSCCPKGDRVKVTFRWQDGKLVPAGEVPSAFERLR